MGILECRDYVEPDEPAGRLGACSVYQDYQKCSNNRGSIITDVNGNGSFQDMGKKMA